jgi:Tol biopolymer transport system component
MAGVISRSFGRSCGRGFLAAACLLPCLLRASEAPPLRERLKKLPFKIAYETYTNDNWEIFVMNADGSNPVNLTQTPNVHEHYPQISPNGDKMCFVADEGKGREAVRTLYVMDIDGHNRKKIADHAREPFWSPDGKIIGFLPQEYRKFDVIDYYTQGMDFYDLATGETTPHVNTTNIHHLYNPSWSQNGKWIAATTHATAKYGHAILLIEAHGDKIINLQIPGCRPCLSPDGKQIAWGAGDHEIAAAPIDLDAEDPKVGEWRLRIKDETNKIYHVDWSPDSRFLSISRGPDGEGDVSKPGTFGAACEIMGVYAPGWNLFAVSAERSGTLDINQAGEQDFQMLTSNGLSNKESAWFWANGKPKP